MYKGSGRYRRPQINKTMSLSPNVTIYWCEQSGFYPPFRTKLWTCNNSLCVVESREEDAINWLIKATTNLRTCLVLGSLQRKESETRTWVQVAIWKVTSEAGVTEWCEWVRGKDKAITMCPRGYQFGNWSANLPGSMRLVHCASQGIHLK